MDPDPEHWLSQCNTLCLASSVFSRGGGADVRVRVRWPRRSAHCVPAAGQQGVPGGGHVWRGAGAALLCAAPPPAGSVPRSLPVCTRPALSRPTNLS